MGLCPVGSYLDYLIDYAILFSLIRGHKKVAVSVVLNFFDGLAGMFA